MAKKILITVGGTGGHVFPSISLANHLRKEDPSIDILFVGGRLSTNRFFTSHAYPHEAVACGGISLLKPIKTIASLGKIGLGILQSKRIIKDFKPDLVVGFGSYYTFPTLIAAKWACIPILLHESNSIPGKVNRLLSRHANQTAIQFPEAARHLKGESVLVKTPLREGFYLGSAQKKDALLFFGLDPAKPAILVFGGSQGAVKINSCFKDAFINHVHPHFPDVQIIHLTGDKKLTEELISLYQKANVQACVKDFEPRMDLAWQAADLVVSRSGAGTIAEELEFEVPGILIPYPHATENHQEYNADFMVSHVGGAYKFLEGHLSAFQLGEAILKMFANDSQVLKDMARKIADYKKGASALKFSQLVFEMIEKKGRML